ncbi:hypothetical protein J6590_053720 [Homalodisca vitripennis]|nr:hypothetical protein J6590_053720 [Homalodisca vitripennis]
MRHSTTGVTALMAASAVYKYEVVEDLVHKHAPSIEIVCKDNKTALDYACHSEEKSGLLEAYHKTEEIHEKENNQADNLEEGQVTISSTDLKRLEQYEKYFEKLLDVIDYHLTVKLLLHIHLNEPEGSQSPCLQTTLTHVVSGLPSTPDLGGYFPRRLPYFIT